MTPQEFVTQEALTFSEGEIVVVSTDSLEALFPILLQARDAIVADGKHCADPLDAAGLVRYSSDTADRAVNFEFISLNAGSTVVLVGNEFDRKSPWQNFDPISRQDEVSFERLRIATVFNLINTIGIKQIPYVADIRDGNTRELFSFISRLYYFDSLTNEITFLKTQNPELPLAQ
jgi:hypothetical protein